ncbi:MAG TPA: hypothetical protein VEC36_02840 [Patescibacteria group bacterium]|nr:hypothetical protein [Patescibacteria group bacterium]
MSELSLHPEIEKLRARVAELRLELRELHQEYYEIQNEILPELAEKYDKLFKKLEVEIQRKTLEASEISRRAEIFTLKLSRGEKLSAEMVKLVNTMIDREFRRFKKSLADAFDKTQQERNVENETKFSHEKTQSQSASSEIPKLYRAIAKKLHPDAAGDVTGNFKKFWANVQEAYQKRNLQKLRALHQILCVEDQFTGKFESEKTELEALEREVRQLEQKTESEKRKLTRIKTNEPFTFKDQIQDETWIAAQMKKLELQLLKKEREIEQANEILKEIIGGNWLQIQKKHEKDDEPFDDDFMRDAYFGGKH